MEQAKNTHFSGSIGGNQVFEAPQHWTGENERQGLFLAYYKGIKPQRMDTSILNLAPTILSLLEVEVPGEMDGEIVKF